MNNESNQSPTPLTFTREEILDAVAKLLIEEPGIRDFVEAHIRNRTDILASLTADEVAQLLKVTPARVYQLPVERIKHGGRTVRFRLKEVEKYIQSRKLAT